LPRAQRIDLGIVGVAFRAAVPGMVVVVAVVIVLPIRFVMLFVVADEVV
jgi:hypothetical protein